MKPGRTDSLRPSVNSRLTNRFLGIFTRPTDTLSSLDEAEHRYGKQVVQGIAQPIVGQRLIIMSESGNGSKSRSSFRHVVFKQLPNLFNHVALGNRRLDLLGSPVQIRGQVVADRPLAGFY